MIEEEKGKTENTVRPKVNYFSACLNLAVLGILGWGIVRGCESDDYNTKHENDKLTVRMSPDSQYNQIVDTRSMYPDTSYFAVPRNKGDSADAVFGNLAFGKFENNGLTLTKWLRDVNGPNNSFRQIDRFPNINVVSSKQQALTHD